MTKVPFHNDMPFKSNYKLKCGPKKSQNIAFFKEPNMLYWFKFPITWIYLESGLWYLAGLHLHLIRGLPDLFFSCYGLLGPIKSWNIALGDTNLILALVRSVITINITSVENINCQLSSMWNFQYWSHQSVKRTSIEPKCSTLNPTYWNIDH